MTANRSSLGSARTSPDLGKVVSKVTRRLIPILLLMYILSFLDRSNIGFAKAAFQADTGISDAAYALGAGIFFIGYALVEVPSNIIMHKVGARIWMTRIMVTWGLISALMMFAQNEWIFYLLRVLLGIAEAGFFPGVILYLTYWIPQAYRAKVNGLFYFGAPLAFIFGGPLSGILLDLDGLLGLHGWQIMFLVTGVLTMCAGIWVFIVLDNSPAHAKWLDADEKKLLLDTIEREDQAKSPHSPKTVLRTLGNPRILYFSLIYLGIQVSVYGVSFYLPSIVSALVGKSVGLEVGLLTAIPWTVAIIATVVLTRLADTTGKRRLIAGSAIFAAGVGISLSVFTANPVLALAALSLAAAGFISVQPVFWTLPSSFIAGTAAAAGLALINSVGALGGTIAPIGKTWAEGLFGPQAGMLFLGVVALLTAVLIWVSGRVIPPVRDEQGRLLSEIAEKA